MDLRRPALIHSGVLALATTLLVHPPLVSAQDDLDALLDTREESGERDEQPSQVEESGRPPSDSPEDSSEAAEKSEPAPEAQAPARRARAIEEIVVTARKKEETLQDVPMSMTALTGDFITEAGAENLHELAEFTPNVRFTRNDAGPRVFIRGFGTPQSVTPFEPTVGMAVDGMQLSNPLFMAVPLFDIERFEVLRGPQGIIFGKNTTAGVFNVTTRRPTNEYTGHLLARVGGLGVRRFEGAIGGPVGPLGDVAQFRLSVLDSRQAGDVENTFLNIDVPATEQRAGRLQLAMQPLDDLDVLVIGERSTTELAGPVFGAIQNKLLRPETLDFLRQFDPQVEDDPFNHQTSIDLDEPFERLDNRIQGEIQYRLPDFWILDNSEITGVFGFAEMDWKGTFEFDFSPADILPSRLPLDYSQLLAEVRLSSFLPGPFGFGNLELQTGLFFFSSHWVSAFPILAGEHFDEYLVSAPAFELVTGERSPGGTGFEDLKTAGSALGVTLPSSGSLEGDGVRPFLDQDVRSQAIFGRADWQLTEDWALGLGGRLTFEQKDAFYKNECFEPGVVCAVFMAEEFEVDLARRETNFSPEVVLQYTPFDNLNLFAKRVAGFKSGGFNHLALIPEATEVDEESTVSWEAGVKGTLFSGTLSYGGTFFNQTVDDLQLQANIGAAVITKNAASARSRGFEFDFRWMTPWTPLSVRGAGTIIDGQFTSFPDAVAPKDAESDSIDLSGRRLPWIPKRQLSITPQLRVPFAGSFLPVVGDFLPGRLVFRSALDMLARSNFYLAPDLDRKTLQDKYVTLNGRLGIGTSDDSWSLDASVKNLTDANVLGFSDDSLTFPNGYFTRQEFQRNFSFALSYRW